MTLKDPADVNFFTLYTEQEMKGWHKKKKKEKKNYMEIITMPYDFCRTISIPILK